MLFANVNIIPTFAIGKGWHGSVGRAKAVYYTHLRAHETLMNLV